MKAVEEKPSLHSVPGSAGASLRRKGQVFHTSLHGQPCQISNNNTGRPVTCQSLATLCLLISERPHLAPTKTTSSCAHFTHILILSGYKIKTE